MNSKILIAGAAIGAGALLLLRKGSARTERRARFADVSFAVTGPAATKYPSTRAITRSDGVMLDPGTISAVAVVANIGNAPGDVIVFLHVTIGNTDVAGNLIGTSRMTIQPGETVALPTLSFTLPAGSTPDASVGAELWLYAVEQNGGFPVSPTERWSSGYLGKIATPVIKSHNIGFSDVSFNVG